MAIETEFRTDTPAGSELRTALVSRSRIGFGMKPYRATASAVIEASAERVYNLLAERVPCVRRGAVIAVPSHSCGPDVVGAGVEVE